tara:strand:- start:212 stop:442 length:231 start_codon:yes stop_codon:yes gene_type:complete
MKKKLLIFGSHEISELATFYFNKENKYNIEGYVLDDEYIDKDSFLDKPLIPYSEVKKNVIFFSIIFSKIFFLMVFF